MTGSVFVPPKWRLWNLRTVDAVAAWDEGLEVLGQARALVVRAMRGRRHALRGVSRVLSVAWAVDASRYRGQLSVGRLLPVVIDVASAALSAASDAVVVSIA